MMKTFLLLPLFLILVKNGWNTDFEKAMQQAQTEQKYVLLNFSGSDWCAPCIRLHKEIFESQAFISYADNSLVLVNADFPRLNKNHLSTDQQKQNNHLADRYNPHGSFPYTVLLNTAGKVLASWDGFPSAKPEKFVDELKAAINAGK